MTERERKSLIATGVIIAIAAIVAWAGSTHSVRIGNFPLFGLCIAIVFVIQWIGLAYGFSNRTEKYYDLTGSITYISVSALALWLSGSSDLRSVLLFALIAIWAVRLGSFLFLRIRADGKDGRFDEIKQSLPRFLVAWTLQGLWVTFSFGAALAAISSANKAPLGAIGIIGLIVWLVGFGIEVTADQQKKAFRQNPANKGNFITTGIWAWSQHPNYFGEIVLWLGVAIIAAPVLQGWQLLTLISPIFVYILLTRISGIPLLKHRSDEKWGGQPAYEQYKANTSVLVPRPPTNKSG